ncbi:zinc finger MYND domain-containing protein [Microdochium nivale]|nr:zinc finger MYND domain-containing protein [Microdochium nivale]
MREVNFSIPNVNKASVGITTALYDRRALDCTSTLPLINSLNHLAYLTTSSARIRDILTVDGGIERLVCILKQGRTKDMMDLWKWNLAFQCVVNIGVRGTETVRTRVVEADMVPVIGTLLDNYIKYIEKSREKAEEAKQKQLADHHQRQRGHREKSTSFTSRTSRLEVDSRAFRRQAPPPSIDVSATYGSASTAAESSHAESSSAVHAGPSTAPAERASGSSHRHHHHHHHHHHRHDPRSTMASPSRPGIQPLATTAPTMEAADGFIRPVRDIDRLPSMAPVFPQTLTSQPASPTTPLPLPQVRSPTVRPASVLNQNGRTRRRPSIRHQVSTSDADDLTTEGAQSDESGDAEMSGTTEIQTTVDIQDIAMDEGETTLVNETLDLNAQIVSVIPETGTFNITHRPSVDGSIPNTIPPSGPTLGLSPNQTLGAIPQPPLPNQTNVSRYLLDRPLPPSPQILAALPREEDVLMSLQLLAYVSKYCNLRSYFQKSHLVPKLKIGKELDLLDSDITPESPTEATEHEEEYLLPNDFNIFPLVEKFTVRYHSTDMQYWAGVVMRNLCRKDDARGGIRQCAYYQCGKWEEFTRQFAKCRRCRRTKYCSKECQKSAWAFHRHWCVAASQC